MRFIAAKYLSARARNAEEGFSLLEILVGFSVAAAVAATSMPSVADMMEAYQLRAATRRVYAELQSLRAQAVTSNLRQRLTTTPNGGSLRFEHLDPQTGQWVDSGVVAHELETVTATMSNDIIFAPNGTAASPGQVALADRHGRHRNVAVSVAGVVRVLH
jgi:Tfp pilus assembly protein FimT